MPFLAKRPSLLVLKPAGSSSSSSSSSTSSFAVAGPSTSVPPPSDAAASSSSSSPPPLDTPGMTVSAAPALVPAARSSTSSSSAPSAAAVQQHRRLVDAWFSLHRFSKADLTEHISNLLQQRRYDELAIACRAIFADHPPTFTNERDPHAAFSSSQQADEAERKGEVEGWQDVDMREKPAKRRALVTKTITGLQQDEAVSERDVGECVEVIKGHLAELGSRYLVVLAYLLTQGVKQAKVSALSSLVSQPSCTSPSDVCATPWCCSAVAGCSTCFRPSCPSCASTRLWTRRRYEVRPTRCSTAHGDCATAAVAEVTHTVLCYCARCVHCS